jgi:hypothetical protein
MASKSKNKIRIRKMIKSKIKSKSTISFTRLSRAALRHD